MGKDLQRTLFTVKNMTGTTAARIESRKIPYLLIAFFFLAIGVGLSGYLYHLKEEKITKQNKFDELSSIAALKVQELTNWRRERIGDAAIIIKNPFIGPAVQEWMEHPTESKLREEILAWMSSLREDYEYDDVILFRTDGTPQLSLNPENGSETGLKEFLPRLTTLKAPLFSDLHAGRQGKVLLRLFAPILNTRIQDAPVVAVLALEIDPQRFLYPLIQSWPTPSHTAETLLICREGDDVVFLNELRHRRNVPLGFRKPVTDDRLPAAMAARSWEGVMEGVDYRGVDVLACCKAIPDSPWALVAKVDIEEIYAPIHERAWLTSIITGLGIAAAGVCLLLLWSYQVHQLQRRQQRELQHAHDDLERKVEERTAEVTAMNEELVCQVAERRQAEKTALEKSRLFEAFFEHSIAPLVFLDKDFNFIRVNQAYARACQRDASEFPGRNHFDLYPSDARDVFESAIQTRQPQKVVARPFVFPDHPEWGITYWDWTLVPILDESGEVEFLVFSLSDVTEQTRTQKALHESQRLYSMAEQAGRIGSWERSFHDDTARWSDGAYRIFGVAPEEFSTSFVNLLGFVHPLDRELLTRAFSASKLHRERFDVQYRIIRRDGIERVVQSVGEIRFDDDGEPTGLIGTMQDITELKKAETELRAHAERLKRSNDALREFMLAASHDLREPLRKIQTFASLLDVKFSAVLGEGGRDYLARMSSSANRMQNLLEALQEYSRTTARSEPFRRCELTGLVRELVDDMGTRLRQTGGRVDVEELPAVEGDPGQMRQLFENLLENALKYRRGDEPPVVRIHPEPAPKGFHRIAVEDNGLGFEEKYRGLIFKPFQRLHRDKAYSGAGMGLAICKRIVERHNGTLVATSTPGAGSIFVVTLPVTQEDPF